MAAGTARTLAARDFAEMSHAFVEALWRIDPDAAVSAGLYEGSAHLPRPDAASRSVRLAFVTDW